MDDDVELSTEPPTSHGKEGAKGPRSNLTLVLLLATAVIGVGAGSFALRYEPGADRGPPPVLYSIEPFSLVDRSGARVALSDLAGKAWVADFVYTSCQTACPTLTSRMGTVQDFIRSREAKSGQDARIRLVSFTVDPEHDTPERLATYATKWNADPRLWLWLTGTLDEVNRAVTAGFKIPFEKGPEGTATFDVVHGEKLVLVDPKGQIRGYYDAHPAGVADLERAIDAVLAEAPGS